MAEDLTDCSILHQLTGNGKIQEEFFGQTVHVQVWNLSGYNVLAVHGIPRIMLTPGVCQTS